MTAFASPAAVAATVALQPSPAALAGQPASALLTRVALAYIEPRFKLYLRFGEPARIIRLIQSGKGYRLAGPERLRVEAKLPTDGARGQRVAQAGRGQRVEQAEAQAARQLLDR